MWHNKTGFPLKGDWGTSALPPKLFFPNVPPLICPQNVDFVIFIQFLAILPNCLPTSRPYLGNPVRTHSQMRHRDKLSQQSSIVSKAIMDEWFTVPLGAQRLWVRICCSHLNFGHCNCFEQGVPWNSEQYIVQIHSKIRVMIRIYSQMHHTDKYLTIAQSF